MILPCLSALVLAGGQSRRMGQDKALLQLQGEALLTRTCLTAMAVSERIMAIASRPDYQSFLPQGCELLLEVDPQGPLQAFAQGLNQLRGHDGDGWVLLLACDLPLLTVEDLVLAIAHLADLPKDIDAYLPPAMSGDPSGPASATKQIDWEPLCGFYRQRCFTSLQEALDQGTRSFQRWLIALKIAPLTHWPAEHLLNCNRHEDWERLLEILSESG